MGERKGQNKYYPPDFDYRVHKSLNGYHGTHALRERARKLDKGILIIRFEMPYNIWCDGCQKHIGMGVRYNAEKSKIGNYYSTPIFKFRMKCHLCPNHFEIKTDPANHDYIILSGARRKEQRWDAHENEQIVAQDKNDTKKLLLDPMYKLEHVASDQTKTVENKPILQKLLKKNNIHKDDFSLNQLARKQFRDSKKKMTSQVREDNLMKSKFSLDIPLLPSEKEDLLSAKMIKLQDHKVKRSSLAGSGVFKVETETKIGLSSNNDSITYKNKKVAKLALETIISNSKKKELNCFEIKNSPLKLNMKTNSETSPLKNQSNISKENKFFESKNEEKDPLGSSLLLLQDYQSSSDDATTD